MSSAGVSFALCLALACSCVSSDGLPPQTAESVPGKGLVCKAMVDRFVGLPAGGEGGGASSDDDLIAGRWWVRSCATRALPGALEIRLAGPGWYWVDVEDGDIALHQQVPFQLEARLFTTFEAAYSEGVASLWLEPTRDPEVKVVASRDLDVRGASVWGWFMRYVPFFPIRELVAKKLSSNAAAALRKTFGRGATVTYDILRGQSDVGLGKLGLGKTPERPFSGRATWIVNERLSLPAGAVQVVGPIEPARSRVIDIDVQAGTGVLYQAVCLSKIGAALPSIVSGNARAIAREHVLVRAAIEGPGLHTTELSVDRCRYGLLVSSTGGAAGVIALRVRE